VILKCANVAVRFDARFKILVRANIYIKNRVLSKGDIELVTEQFNTNAKALVQRIEANEKYGSYDINEWIFSQLELKQGLLTLELGPGNGKQTLPLAQLTQNNVLAIDISSEALEMLMEAARKRNLNNFIIPQIGNFDELDKILSTQSLIEKNLVKDFDRVISCFSIYYSKNPSKLFQVVNEVMSPKGVLFFCGPSRENNIELIRFHNKVRGEVLEDKPTFMESEGIELAQRYFRVEVSKFENPLRFTKPKDLYNYWSSYYLYDEAIESKFKSEIKQYFLKHPMFETVKRVIGVKAWKR
jgi:SAM-dependent methyltransferase